MFSRKVQEVAALLLARKKGGNGVDEGLMKSLSPQVVNDAIGDSVWEGAFDVEEKD
jgi:hypothetical protein